MGRTDAPHFDPHYNRGWLFFPNTAAVFNNLIRFSPTNPEEIIPELAERWEFSPDKKSVTFYLRQGVKWHDGKPFTAADVKFSLERMADTKRSLEVSGALKKVIGSIDILYQDTVKVNLKVTSASFMSILASGAGVMQAQHIADNYEVNDTRRLVGTGPFKFKEYIPGVSFEVAKNPDYWDTGKPYLDGVICYVVIAEEAQIAAIVGKRVDMTHTFLGVRTWPMVQELQVATAAPRGVLTNV